MMPFSTLSPARWASIASGRTPAPTTTVSHSIARPLFVSTARTRPSPSKASSSSPPWIVTPWLSIVSWNQRPASSPKVRERTMSSIITIVHLTPFAVSEAATSVPM